MDWVVFHRLAIVRANLAYFWELQGKTDRNPRDYTND